MLIVNVTQSRAFLVATPAEFEELVERSRSGRATLATAEEQKPARVVPLASVLPRVSL